MNKFFQEEGRIAVVYDPIKNETGVFSKGGIFRHTNKEEPEESLFKEHQGVYVTREKPPAEQTP